MTLVERMREAADMLVKGYNLAGASMILTEAAARIEAMDEHGPDIPETRQYLPTLAELIDRLSIVLLKSIFISEHREAYLMERDAIEHDIGLLLKKHPIFNSSEVLGILVLMLTNRYIWENESKARQGGSEQDKLLKLTHSINGIRNAAKNFIAVNRNEREDSKIDCFAAELEKEFGNWNVFEDLK